MGSIFRSSSLFPLMQSLSNTLPGDLLKTMWEGPQSDLDDTVNAQPAIFLDSYLHYLSSQSSFRLHIGHSVGEYSALCAAGCISPETAMKVLRRRGELMKEASRGRDTGMLAVSSGYSPSVQDIHNSLSIPSDMCCDLAAINSP